MNNNLLVGSERSPGSRSSICRRWLVSVLTALATAACSEDGERTLLHGDWDAWRFETSAPSEPQGDPHFKITFRVTKRWWGGSELQTDCGDERGWHEVEVLEAHRSPRSHIAGEFGLNCSTLSEGLRYVEGWFAGQKMVGKITGGHIGGSRRETFHHVTTHTYLFLATKQADVEGEKDSRS